MIRFKSLVKIPSAALQAMVDGLEEQSKRPNIRIDMRTYWTIHSETNACFACAATCAIMKVAGVNFDADDHDNDLEEQDICMGENKRVEHCNAMPEDYSEFEWAMNDARKGSLSDLFEYLGIAVEDVADSLLRPDFSLDDDWREQLPAVRQHIELLKSHGY